MDKKSKQTTTSYAKKIARMGILVALAMIFSYVEVLIPISIGVPGMKLGLANLVIVIGLYLLNAGEVFLISFVRILLVSMLFGNAAAMAYSLAGGILSFLVMTILSKTKTEFSIVGVSVLGAVFHNIGQIGMAFLLLSSTAIFYYLPVLLFVGVLTGMVIGMMAQRCIVLINKLDKNLI